MYVFKKYRFLLKNTGLWASKYRFVFPEVGMSGFVVDFNVNSACGCGRKNFSYFHCLIILFPCCKMFEHHIFGVCSIV